MQTSYLPATRSPVQNPESSPESSPGFITSPLAVDTVDGRGFSYEARRVLLPKKEQGNIVFAVHYTVKAI